MIKDYLTKRIQEQTIYEKKGKLLCIDCLFKYNDQILMDQMMSFIASHLYGSDSSNNDMVFTLLNDDDLYDFIYKEVNEGSRAEVVTLSYCSKEKGTLRALKFMLDGYNVYLAQKTPAIFVESVNERKFIYVVNSNYVTSIKFKLDGFKFFEHILNKIMNIQGSVLFHGAAVDNNGGIILVGPKRCGKTTIFMDMLRVLDCEPMAFDKCHLIKKEDGIQIFGMPTRMRVLAGTLSKYGDELSYLIPDNYRNASHDQLWAGKSDGKIDMSFDDFEKFCKGKNFKLNSKLRMVIIPNISQNSKSCISNVSYEEFRDLCAMQVFTPDNREEDWWSDCGKGSDNYDFMNKNRDDIINYIWNNIPIVKVSASNNTKDILHELKEKYLDK